MISLPLFAVFSAIFATSIAFVHEDISLVRFKREADAEAFAEPEPKPVAKSVFSNYCIQNIGSGGTPEDFCKVVAAAGVEYSANKCQGAVTTICKAAIKQSWKESCQEKLENSICTNFIAANKRMKVDGKFKDGSFALSMYDACVKKAKGSIKDRTEAETTQGFCTRASAKIQDICYDGLKNACNKIEVGSDSGWGYKIAMKGAKKACQLSIQYLICG